MTATPKHYRKVAVIISVSPLAIREAARALSSRSH